MLQQTFLFLAFRKRPTISPSQHDVIKGDGCYSLENDAETIAMTRGYKWTHVDMTATMCDQVCLGRFSVSHREVLFIEYVNAASSRCDGRMRLECRA